MEEIIEVDGEKYRIFADGYFSDKEWKDIKLSKVMELSKTGCKECNKGLNLSPATGCGVYVRKGESKTISFTASGGSGTLTKQILEIKPDNSSSYLPTIPYTRTFDVVGTWKYSGRVADTCAIPQSCFDPVGGTYCEVYVYECPALTCDLTIS